MNDEKKFKDGIFSGIVGIIVNFILASLKLICGILTLSISIIADAINNYSDMASSIVSFVGFKISAKPADEEHPYGHKRMEYIAALILAVIILAIDIELIFTSVKGIINPKDLKISVIAGIVLLVSIIAKAFLGLFYMIIYKRHKSIALKAAAVDSFSDCITTSVVLAGVIIYHFTGFKYTDGICGIVVAIMILYAAIDILRDASSTLLGEEMDETLFKNIVLDLKSYPDILGIHDVECHMYGQSSVFMSVHAEIDGTYSLTLAHDIIDKVEKDISKKYSINIVIHPDPVQLSDEAIKLKEMCTSLLHEINKDLFLHDFHIDESNISFECIEPRNSQMNRDEISSKIKNAIPNYNIEITFEYGYISSKELDVIRK